MTTAHICIMAAIIVYLGAMIFVGYLCSKNNNDSSDFYLGGRKLGPLVTAMSAEASDMSSWLLMGLPGLAYLTGIADAGWTATHMWQEIPLHCHPFSVIVTEMRKRSCSLSERFLS